MADIPTLMRVISTAVTAASLIFGVSVFAINSRRERVKRTNETSYIRVWVAAIARRVV